MARRVLRHPSGQEGAAEGPEVPSASTQGPRWCLAGVYPRGLPPQAHQEGPAAEDVLSGRCDGRGPGGRPHCQEPERVAETLPGLPPSLFWVLGTCLQDEQKPEGRKIHTPAAAGPLCSCQRQFAGPYSRAQRSSQQVPAASRSPFVSSLPRAQLVDSNPSLPGWG